MHKNFWNKNESIIRSDIMVTPNLVSTLGAVKGKNILDLGCGDGTIGDLLSKKGANITGVDKNNLLINEAKTKEGKYILDDILSVDFNKNTFDIIYSSMTFLFLNDSELFKLFSKIYSWLKSGGSFVVADIHPSAELPTAMSKWATYKSKNVYNYFETITISAVLQNSIDATTSFNYYHRSIETYVNTFIKCRFKLDSIQEISPNHQKYVNMDLSYELIYPTYILFKFTK